MPVNDPISRVGGTRSPEDALVGNSIARRVIINTYRFAFANGKKSPGLWYGPDVCTTTSARIDVCMYALGHNQCGNMMYVCMAGAQMYEGVVFYLVARMREIRAHEVLRDAFRENV